MQDRRMWEERKFDKIWGVAELTLNSGLNAGTAAAAFASAAFWLIYLNPDRCYEGVVAILSENRGGNVELASSPGLVTSRN